MIHSPLRSALQRSGRRLCFRSYGRLVGLLIEVVGPASKLCGGSGLRCVLHSYKCTLQGWGASDKRQS